MKRLFKMMALAVCAVLLVGVGLFSTACTNDNIAVMSRENNSGSKMAFDASIHNGKAAGQGRMLLGGTPVTTAGLEVGVWQSATNRIPGDSHRLQSAVISAVERNKNAIGYASYSAVSTNNRVKMLKIDGIAPGETGYNSAFVRDFVILVPQDVELMPRTQEFYDFLTSTQAKAATEEFGLDFGAAEGTIFNPNKFTSAPEQTHPIQIRGSTTVEPLMEALIAEFVKIVPWANPNMFNLFADGSGDGRRVGQKQTISGAGAYIEGAAIGMSSSGSDNVAANGKTFRLAYDTTVIIVHPDNQLTTISIPQIFDIYTGTVKSWSELVAV
ncbi:MAG: substrate-binding domain-containing protein [Firmicutes bacterium]|nr:substrate-binding domain-containing protein [Bacillota bacterium]